MMTSCAVIGKKIKDRIKAIQQQRKVLRQKLKARRVAIARVCLFKFPVIVIARVIAIVWWLIDVYSEIIVR